MESKDISSGQKQSYRMADEEVEALIKYHLGKVSELVAKLSEQKREERNRTEKMTESNKDISSEDEETKSQCSSVSSIAEKSKPTD